MKVDDELSGAASTLIRGLFDPTANSEADDEKPGQGQELARHDDDDARRARQPWTDDPSQRNAGEGDLRLLNVHAPCVGFVDELRTP